MHVQLDNTCKYCTIHIHMYTYLVVKAEIRLETILVYYYIMTSYEFYMYTCSAVADPGFFEGGVQDSTRKNFVM